MVNPNNNKHFNDDALKIKIDSFNNDLFEGNNLVKLAIQVT